MPARRATRVERAGESFSRHPRDAQFACFRNQLLENHRTMAKRFGARKIFFPNAVRVNKRFDGVHADVDRAEEFRYRFAFSLCEELSSRSRVVGDKCARYAQTGALGETELALFVLSVALAVEIVYPMSVVKCVEKTFERGDGLADAHRS